MKYHTFNFPFLLWENLNSKWYEIVIGQNLLYKDCNCTVVLNILMWQNSLRVSTLRTHVYTFNVAYNLGRSINPQNHQSLDTLRSTKPRLRPPDVQ